MKYITISTNLSSYKSKLDVPDKLFTESATKIADFLFKKSTSLKQAISRVSFYVNRAGSKLNAEDKQKFELVKTKLRNKFSKWGEQWALRNRYLLWN